MRIAWGGYLLVLALALVCAAQQATPPTEDEILQRFEPAEALYLRALDYFQRQNLAASRVEVEKCLGLMPEHAEAHYLLARIYARLGADRRALSQVDKAETYFDYLAKVRSREQEKKRMEIRGLRDDQNALLAELKENLVQCSDASLRRRILTQIQEVEKIRDSLNDRLAFPLPPEPRIPADFYSFHGDILRRLNKPEQAEVEFRKAILADPMRIDSYNRLARFHFDCGRPGKALEILEQAELMGLAVDEKLKRSVLKALGK
jgi:Tfp pilus assembly protein PilF